MAYGDLIQTPGEIPYSLLNALPKWLRSEKSAANAISEIGRIIGGQFAIRVANSTHRTRKEDMDLRVEAVINIGEEILALEL